MIFKVRQGLFTDYYYISSKFDGVVRHFIQPDGTIVTASGCFNDLSVGHWTTKKEATIFLAGWNVLNPQPSPAFDRLDSEPQFDLGTRHVQYVKGIRVVHKYVKVDCGHGVIQHQWAS